MFEACEKLERLECIVPDRVHSCRQTPLSEILNRIVEVETTMRY